MRARRRVDRARIIGTLDERIQLHVAAKKVLDIMPELHPELDIDIEALEHIRIGFLREPCGDLWGYCSYSSGGKRYATEYQDRHRTHRILISRVLLQDDPRQAFRTIHHEFLHAILGSAEGHGPIFKMHEERFIEAAQMIGIRGGLMWKSPDFL